MTFVTRLRYRFGDIDDAGIAYYPKLLHYFHCAFEDWFSDGLRIPYPKVMHEEKLGLTTVKLEAEFFSPVRYGDEPDVHLGVLRIGTKSVEFGFWMTRGVAPEPLCRARVVTAVVNMETLQSEPLSDVWRQRFASFAMREEDFPRGR